MAHDHKFRFGVQTNFGTDRSQWREHAKKVEGLGYSTLYMPDHFLETELAPIPALAMAAAATTTLNVGTLVLGNDYKHPAVVAKEAATIEALAPGRVEWGIGAGWMKVDYDALGWAYDKPSVRIERLDEAIQIVEGCWSGQPFSFSGKHYDVTDYTGIPTPTAKIPILVGGGGEKLLTVAGTHADIVGINPNLRKGAVTDDAAKDSVASQTVQKIEWVRKAAGDRFDDIELQIRYFLCAVNNDRRAFAESIAPAFGISAEEALESGVACVGTVDEICDQLVERRQKWGVSYIIVGDDNFESLAPVVERLVGT